MKTEVRVDPSTIESYRQSCLKICAAKLDGYRSLDQVTEDEDMLNAYPRLGELDRPEGVINLDPAALTPDEKSRAVESILEGRFLAEHAAAGEATRLKMGTKYLINPKRQLTIEQCASMLADEESRPVEPAEILEKSRGARPEELLDLSLGERHMLQIAFDLTALAQENGRRAGTVLENQWLIVILNEKSGQEILENFVASHFFGFNPAQVIFMVQVSFEGINLQDGRFFFDPAAPRRLHNHGQMAMQQTAEEQLFRLDRNDAGTRTCLSREEARGMLEGMDDKLSYNIEDLAYLTGSLDLDALALALSLGDKGMRMVMEIVANNPVKPQKGGLAAFDRVLGRNVMIESFQLEGLPNEEIAFLNRNFNHYPKPLAAFDALSEGLPMPLAVKGGRLYFQPVQGDLNFLLPTAFVQRKVLSPISNWKSAATTPLALAAMADQDRQPGFKEFAGQILKRGL